MNNGILQATVAYKESYDGTPLDVNGRPTYETGRKQAIALLEGIANPNPSLYEIELYFDEGGFILGTPTSKVDFESCPVGNFTFSKNYIVLTPDNPQDTINIFSTYGWDCMPGQPFDTWVTVSPILGSGNILTPVTFITNGGNYGQGKIYFKERATGQIKYVYVVNTDALGWVLENGFWNNLRFWQYNGIWNY